MIIEIKPGSKLNIAVAKAIGLTWQNATRFKMAAWHHEDGWCYRTLPSFSKDLDEAFRAASRVDLFEPPENTNGQGPWVSLARGPLGWLVMKDEVCVGKGDTPALAICAAILKLKPIVSLEEECGNVGCIRCKRKREEKESQHD